ncbi:arginine--tRNA ligase [Oleidesulfovibrio sp.]|uniref:arginine--tRNA ligase n=1 Tax=Oleidesulfovibrio sp. TaxID=2909707 RepID=UPI003A85B4D6
MRAKNHLEAALKVAIADLGLPWPEKFTIEPPKDKKFGDLAVNIAMVLAKPAKMPPREIAGRIAEHLSGNPDISGVEIAGPGFINVTYAPEFWHKTVPAVEEAKDSFGGVNVGNGRKVQVEYVSANPTGPLHIGHGRGAAVGDSLARMLRFTGFEVSTEYYINDAGRQMLLLGDSVYYRAKQIKGMDVAEPEDYYRGDYIHDIAQEVLDMTPDLLEKPEEEGRAICQKYAVDTIMAGIKQDLENFSVEHQVWFSEKSLVETGAVDKTFDRLRKAGLAYEEDGALWFRTTDFGDDKNRVLKKSNGYLTYFASDIAYHDNKYDRGFDLCVDIWGADHHGYVPRMRAAVAALGKPADSFDVILVQLVNLLRNGEQIAMSTRAGEFETLADVVKEVGADAARFMFLSRKSDSSLDFDLELVKQRSMDNPVYYVQYAHARICSVMRKAAERGITLPDATDIPVLAPLANADEIDMLRLLDRFEDTMETAAGSLSVHHISYYLQDLASALHRFYANNPVLNAPDESVLVARLALLRAVAQVLRNGLKLLGVSAPDAM